MFPYPQQDPLQPRGMIILVQLDEIHAQRFLSINLRFYILKAHWSETVEIDSHIVHRLRAHAPDTFGIAASLAGLVGMHVTKQMPRAVVQLPTETKKRFVVEDDRLTIHGDEHLQRHLLEVSRVPVPHVLKIVVAVNKVLPTLQPRQIPIVQLRTTKSHVPKQEDDVVVLHHRIPPLHQSFVHRIGVREWPVAEPDDILVPQVQIGREEHILLCSGKHILLVSYIILHNNQLLKIHFVCSRPEHVGGDIKKIPASIAYGDSIWY